MFNMFGGKPVPKPSPVVVVAPTRQRNEKEVMMISRPGNSRTTGGQPRQRVPAPHYNIMEAGEVIVVDPVRDEHNGFVYTVSLSGDKQTRHHETKASRREAYDEATAMYLRAQDNAWADDGVVLRQRAVVAERVEVQALREKVALAEDPQMVALRTERARLSARLTASAMLLHDSPQAREEYRAHATRKVVVGGTTTVVPTVSGATVSDEPARKK